MGLGFGANKFPVLDGMTFWLNIGRNGFVTDFTNEINPNFPVCYDRIQGLRVNVNNINASIGAGALYYRFISNGFLSVDTGSEKVPMDGECTLVMVLYTDSISVRRTVFEKAGTTNNSYEQEIAVTWEAGNNMSWYSRVTDYDFGNTAGWGTAIRPIMVGIRMSTGKIAGVARRGWYSINGAPWVESYTSRSTNPITPAGRITIGTGYAGTVSDGNSGIYGISQCMIWNRQISDSEIAAVYSEMQSYHINL